MLTMRKVPWMLLWLVSYLSFTRARNILYSTRSSPLTQRKVETLNRRLQPSLLEPIKLPSAEGIIDKLPKKLPNNESPKTKTTPPPGNTKTKKLKSKNTPSPPTDSNPKTTKPDKPTEAEPSQSKKMPLLNGESNSHSKVPHSGSTSQDNKSATTSGSEEEISHDAIRVNTHMPSTTTSPGERTGSPIRKTLHSGEMSAGISYPILIAVLLLICSFAVVILFFIRRSDRRSVGSVKFPDSSDEEETKGVIFCGYSTASSIDDQSILSSSFDDQSILGNHGIV